MTSSFDLFGFGHNTCPFCGSPNIVFRSDTGEYVCADCGAVLGTEMYLTEYEDKSLAVAGRTLPIAKPESYIETSRMLKLASRKLDRFTASGRRTSHIWFGEADSALRWLASLSELEVAEYKAVRYSALLSDVLYSVAGVMRNKETSRKLAYYGAYVVLRRSGIWPCTHVGKSTCVLHLGMSEMYSKLESLRMRLGQKARKVEELLYRNVALNIDDSAVGLLWLISMTCDKSREWVKAHEWDLYEAYSIALHTAVDAGLSVNRAVTALYKIAKYDVCRISTYRDHKADYAVLDKLMEVAESLRERNDPHGRLALALVLVLLVHKRRLRQRVLSIVSKQRLSEDEYLSKIFTQRMMNITSGKSG